MQIMPRDPWTENNKVNLKKVQSKRKTINTIRIKLARFIHHVMRKKTLESIATTGNTELYQSCVIKKKTNILRHISSTAHVLLC